MIKKNTTDEALDILKALKDLSISLDVLTRSRIGLLVNLVRKQTTNDDVAVLAKQLIRGWKRLVPATEGKKDKSHKSSSKSSEKKVEAKVTSTSERPASSQKADKSEAMVLEETIHTKVMPQIQPTADPVRDKCREMLSRGLQATDDVSQSFASRLSAAIETAIFKEFGNTQVKYKNRVRSRYSNLKDTKNASLRTMVINGQITPEQIAIMTSEEMASDDLKQERKEMEVQNIKDHQMAKNEGTKTDMFTCGRCKGKACTYNQLQTRSSDEPMTTFVFCTECGNRWKFC